MLSEPIHANNSRPGLGAADPAEATAGARRENQSMKEITQKNVYQNPMVYYYVICFP